MEITLSWKNEGFHFEGQDDRNIQVAIDGNRNLGPSPMEMLLHAAGACAAIDVLDILHKMRMEITALRARVTGTRMEGKGGRPWKSIHIEFEVEGDIPRDKILRAIDLSLEKYCSVALNLRPTTEVTASLAE